MDTDMDTFATALYVKIDDELVTNPLLRIWRPAVGIAPQLSDAELLTMAVIQALLGFTSETRFLRFAHEHLCGFFPYLPHQWLQQAAPEVPGPAQRPDPGTGSRCRSLGRRHLGDRLHPGRVRTLGADSQKK